MQEDNATRFMPTRKMKVCDRCGGDNVFHDAWVGVNDPTDVRTFDATFCEDCEGACGLTTKIV